MKSNRHMMRMNGTILFFLFALLFFIVFIRFLSIQITREAEGRNLLTEAEKKYRKNDIIESSRGTIYDQNNIIIAEDGYSYKLTAILDPTVTFDPHNPLHVKDPKRTATILSKYLDMSKKEILERLSQKHVFQIEFGIAGQGISDQLKRKIEKENLPGLTFIKEPKRNYPNGYFASHLIGFTQNLETKNGTKQIGMLGIEKSLNAVLAGKDGQVNFNSDVWGYLLPNGKKHVTPPQNGNDVHLSIDKKIQVYMEETLDKVEKEYQPKQMFSIVSNPKTGEILAMGQRPTFNENLDGLDHNWNNFIVESSFEPGSTMKAFSLAAAVDSHSFNPNATYQSGKYFVSGYPNPIKDWNNGAGWGTVTFLEGVQRSSNVAFANLLQLIGVERYKEYLGAFQFGKKVGIDLPNEALGKILYDYPIEKVTTIFGQGSTVTALQMIQAISAIANDGNMMKPQIISEIVNSSTKAVIKQFEPKVVGTPISKEAARLTRQYLATTVSSAKGTGQLFNIPNVQVAGKSGTAQISNPDGGGYLTGRENYLFSFIGMAPADDPEVVVYVGIQQPELPPSEIGSVPVAKLFNPIMEKSLKYRKVQSKETPKVQSEMVPSLKGETVSNARKILIEKGFTPIILGTGDMIMKQSSKKGTKLLPNEKVILTTNDQLTIPDMTGWSIRDVSKVASLTNLTLKIEGSGFLMEQSIKANRELEENDVLKASFEQPTQ
ncbi:penicillin-binding protein 2B [Bacillus pakistanensis]|uniref:serine-type D-Ala-D-Ala carboxypeptidase n=1 Tax=Rossellomorea pakistanensis TaxID=992288 RepID=A0ABS2NJG3_9BACI|nr:penicillin-binding protein [Bacillus pakistanensis]MBM7587992.1 penicillin-binding protein 2B [Bacillus pakistanensis]